MKTEASLSRRRLLAHAPAIAAAMAPAASALGELPAAVGDDPVFAAIEAHRQALRELGAAYSAHADLEEADLEDSPEWTAAEIRINDAGDRHADALFDFLMTPPITVAGAIAALDYAASPMFPDQKGANLKQTIQIDGSMSGNREFVEAAAQYPAIIAAALRTLLPEAQS